MEFHVHIPFVELLGIRLVRFESREAEMRLKLRDELTNSFGVAHGGVSMALLDAAMAYAARSPDGVEGEPLPGVVTLEMKTSFLRPGSGELVAQGKVLHRTATIAFCEGSVLEPDGTLVAHATATFKYMQALPVGRREIRRPDTMKGTP